MLNGRIRLGGFRNLAIALKKKDPVKSQRSYEGAIAIIPLVGERTIELNIGNAIANKTWMPNEI